MRMFAKAILVLLIAALLLSMLPLGGAQGETGLGENLFDSMVQPDKRPVEAAAENLFNKGIGNAWVGGDPFASSTGTGYNQMHGVASLDLDYRIIGYLNVASGLIVASDNGNSLHFTPGPGNYPVYGFFKANKMMGIFIDFNL
jgi:hypothetical protein